MIKKIIKEEFDKAFKKNFPEAVIIDGVNVAGCNDFYKEWDNWSGKDNYRCQDYLSGMCAGNNCYYKQLKRLEQENKELKEKIIELSEEKGHLIVENNTLKESNQSLSILGTDLASANETIRKEFFRADKNKDMWRETAEKYRSALEAIKVICDWENEHYSLDIDEYKNMIVDIENKINEVLNPSE